MRLVLVVQETVVSGAGDWCSGAGDWWSGAGDWYYCCWRLILLVVVAEDDRTCRRMISSRVVGM